METRTEISSLGEFGLIKRINEGIKISLPDTIRGIGDDAAVIDTGEEYGCSRPICCWKAFISTLHFSR
jgi:thiamine-monophosphate kinase